MKDNEKPPLTVTLTDREPITIMREEWPVIARCERGSVHWARGLARITVRKHADGRVIVAGKCDSRFDHVGLRAGELLVPGADVREAIRKVASVLYSDGQAAGLAQGCIADLPAEVI